MKSTQWKHLWTASLLITVLSVFCVWRFWSISAPPNIRTDIPQKVLTGWKHHWGDSPVDENGIPIWTYEEIESVEWVTSEDLDMPPGRNGADFLWFKVPIPEGDWLDPSLLLNICGDVEAYVDADKIYQLGELKPATKLHLFSHWQIIPLQKSHLGKMLFLRIYSPYKLVGLSVYRYVGSRSDLLLDIFIRGLDFFIVNLMLIFIGILSLSMFVFLREKEYLFFGGFALFSGLALFNWPGYLYPYLGYSMSFDMLLTFFNQIAPLCLVCFYETIYCNNYWKAVSFLRIILFFLFLIELCVCSFDLSWGFSVDVLFHQLFGLTIFIMLVDIIRLNMKDVKETGIYLIGLILYSLLIFKGKIYYLLIYFNMVPGNTPLTYEDYYGSFWQISGHYAPLILSFMGIAILVRRLKNYTVLEVRNQELVKLDKMKSQFVSQASHDLRTPLTAIKGSLDNLLMGIAGELTEKQSKVMTRATKSVDRLTNLINDVLDLSRIESGRIVLEKTDVPFKALVENIISENQPAADQKQIKLTCEYGEGDFNIHIDGGKIERVVGELISNAIKYTPEKGSVDIRLWQDDKTVSLSVKDSGIGMTSEECLKIWERFYRTTASKHFAKGSGLGLSIAKDLVELHGGTLVVESKQGQGTSFKLNMPLN